MASQQEVIDAFFNGESSPFSASNFRLYDADGGLTAYLVGDDAVVYAMREPMGQYTVWAGFLTGGDIYRSDVDTSIMVNALRNQQDATRNEARNRYRNGQNVDFMSAESPRPVTEFDDLESLHP